MRKSFLVILIISVMLIAACGSKGAALEAASSEAAKQVADVEQLQPETTASATAETVANDTGKTETVTTDTEKAETVTAGNEKAETEVQEVAVDKSWKYNVDISWIDPEKPMVALSFDDGPVSPCDDFSTGIRIQNALADNGMHATFFYWGVSLNDSSRKEIERAYELGFELGNHTRTHSDLAKLSPEEIDKEIAYMDGKLSEIADQEHFLVRPPYLSLNDQVKETIVAPLITCGLDTKDWDNASTQQIIDTIVHAAENGSLDRQIVLMHETYTTTAEAMEYLVPYLKDAGYQIVSISEMYCALGKNMSGGKVYTRCAK